MASTVERDLELDNARLGAMYFLANLKTDGWDVKKGFEALSDVGGKTGEAAKTVSKVTAGPPGASAASASPKGAAPAVPAPAAGVASGIREMAAKTAKDVIALRVTRCAF